MKEIYIVLSHTKSVISSLIHLATGDPYTHVSICFGEDTGIMYSFGRLNPYNPFWGGFVRESVSFGTMMRFREADVAVISIRVTESEYEGIQKYVLSMYKRRRQYGYNYIGLLGAKFGVSCRWENHYYCSEFIKELLEKFELVSEDELPKVVRPVDFFKLRRGKLIYRGKLYKFAQARS